MMLTRIHGFATDWRLYRLGAGPGGASQIGVWLPTPLSVRLDVLAEIGEDAWAPTRRKEVLAALLLNAPARGRFLKQTIERYRAARVSDAFVPGFEQWRFLYPPNSPGPRQQLSLFEEHPRPKDPPSASPEEPLRSAKAHRMGMMVPWPLVGRLKVLIAIANESGVGTSQQELIGALVLAAPAAGEKLGPMLDRYWHGSLKDALVQGREKETVDLGLGSDGQTRRRRRHPRPKRTG